MSNFETAESECSATADSTDLEQRDVRALTEYMTVLSIGGGVYSVTTESGSEYRVDALEGRCTCPDKHYNLEDGELCKHERRVRFATGQWAIPSWVDTDAVDPALGDHVEGEPQVAATDGGVTLDAFGEDDADDHECDCDELPGNFPCWPCVRDGRHDLPEGDE